MCINNKWSTSKTFFISIRAISGNIVKTLHPFFLSCNFKYFCMIDICSPSLLWSCVVYLYADILIIIFIVSIFGENLVHMFSYSPTNLFSFPLHCIALQLCFKDPWSYRKLLYDIKQSFIIFIHFTFLGRTLHNGMIFSHCQTYIFLFISCIQ